MRTARAAGRADLYDAVADSRRADVKDGVLRLGIAEDFAWALVTREDALEIFDTALAELKLRVRPYRTDAHQRELDAAIERLKELSGGKLLVR